MAAASSSLTFVCFLLLSVVFSLKGTEAQANPPIVNGLSWTFYTRTCPNLEKIVRDELKKVFKRNIGLAAALLRIHFHDCFVQGCDGSVLLDGSASGPGEKEAPPNLSLRPEAFTVLNDLRAAVQRGCGQTVSCSDILAIAARDSVALSGGPNYKVPLGRRDGLNFATRNATLANLPRFDANTTTLINALARLNLNPTDLVALSGGHTIGIGHCPSFTGRLYPNQDASMDKTFANNLKRTCPAANTDNTTVLDIRSPNVFDNKYYVDLMNRQGLFTSDQDLYTDSRTRSIVTSYAVNQSLFFEQFARSMIKMGQLSVLTSGQGEIRANCSRRNAASAVVDLESVTDGHADGFAAAY